MLMPDPLEFMTADTVAECLNYQKHLTEEESVTLYRKLYSFLSEASNPTPQGGDGSNGTVELPEDRLDPSNDDKAEHWWDRLNEREQRAITLAAEEW